MIAPHGVLKKRVFPPPRLAGLERSAAAGVLALNRTLRAGRTALFAGAGVSASAGVPDWKSLLHQVAATFFTHWELDISHGRADEARAPSLSIALWDDIFWTDSALAAAQALAVDDALLVAQQIRNCLDEHNWQYLLRKLIYGDDFRGYRTASSELLTSLADFADCCRPVAVINYNYDDLLDQALTARGHAFVPVWKNRPMPPPDKTPVFHPHGYLPLGGGPFTTIVMGEKEYHQEATEPYSWSNLIQLQYLASHACVFVGHSLTDPSLRRLLRLTATTPQLPKRYAFLPFPTDPDRVTTMRRTLFDNELRHLGVSVIRFPAGTLSKPEFSELPKLLMVLAAAQANPDYLWQDA